MLQSRKIFNIKFIIKFDYNKYECWYFNNFKESIYANKLSISIIISWKF